MQLAGTKGGTPCSCLTLKSLCLGQSRALRGRELNPGLLRDRQEILATILPRI